MDREDKLKQMAWLEWSIERDTKTLNELEQETGHYRLRFTTSQQMEIDKLYGLWKKNWEGYCDNEWTDFVLWIENKIREEEE